MKHTPGPWIVDNPMEASEFEHGIFKDNGAIAYIAPVLEMNDMGISFEEWDANANLIAAAPDMLEALELLADEFKEWLHSEIASENNPKPWEVNMAWICAKEAIAKAKGE